MTCCAALPPNWLHSPATPCAAGCFAEAGTAAVLNLPLTSATCRSLPLALPRREEEKATEQKEAARLARIKQRIEGERAAAAAGGATAEASEEEEI